MRLTLSIRPLAQTGIPCLLLILLSAGFSASATTAPAIGITTFNSNFTVQTPLLGATPTPGTVDNPGSPACGWDFTIAASGGTVSMSAADDGANPGGLTDFSIKASRGTAGDFITSFAIKSDDGSAFNLQYAYLKINLFTGSTSADMTITGYKSGVAVKGATMTITGILTNPVWTEFNVSAIAAFGDVDEFVFTQAASSSSQITFVAVDQIDIGSASVDLPLVLTSFSGHQTGNNVLLDWTTTSEQNTRNFEVQRGIDGINYITVGQLPAAGNSSQPLDYHYTDTLPPISGSDWYYRLQMVDLSGQYTYSPVLLIGGPASSASFSAYPNPFIGQFNVIVQAAAAGKAGLLLTDEAGHILLNRPLTLQQGTNIVPLAPAGRLSRGVYLLVLTGPAGRQVIRVVKNE